MQRPQRPTTAATAMQRHCNGCNGTLLFNEVYLPKLMFIEIK